MRPETARRCGQLHYGKLAVYVVKDDLFDAHIFYWNVVNREANNELIDLVQEKQTKILALRTLGGGINNAGVPEDRAKALDELYERSSCKSQVDFRVRFILSQPNVLTTIRGAGKVDRLKMYLDAERSFEPLPQEIIDEINALHRQWFA